MSVSAIPAATLALVATFTTRLPNLAVIDGPAYDPPVAFLAVGWDRVDAPSTLAARTVNGPGFGEDEDFDISCLLSFAYDDPEISDARAALFDAFGTVCDTLAADRTLGGAVKTSRITAYDLTTSLLDSGAVADLRFTVHGQACL